MLGLVAILGAYVVAVRRGAISADDDVAPWLPRAGWRPVLFGAGLLIAYVALQSPLDRGGDDFLFALHMLQHVLLMMVAPPLLLLGICGAGELPAGAPQRWVRRVWAEITRPWVSTLLFTAVLLDWHIPTLYDATLTTAPIHIFEHLTFITAGVLFWWPIVDPGRPAGARRIGPFEKISILVVSGIPPTALGLIFAVATRPFYEFYARAPRLWGLTPVNDQQIAGVIMFGLGNLIYFVAVSIVFVRLLSTAPADDDGSAMGVEDRDR